MKNYKNKYVIICNYYDKAFKCVKENQEFWVYARCKINAINELLKILNDFDNELLKINLIAVRVK